MPGCEIIEYNIQVDHIHMVMIIPPRYAVSEVVDRIKGMTASLLRKKFSWLVKVYWKENVVWLPGYFVSTVGVGGREILKYVKWQQSQNSSQANEVINVKEKSLQKLVDKITERGGVDITVIAAGEKSSVQEASKIVKKRGRIVVPAIFDELPEVDMFEIVYGEQNIQGSWTYTGKKFQYSY